MGSADLVVAALTCDFDKLMFFYSIIRTKPNFSKEKMAATHPDAGSDFHHKIFTRNYHFRSLKVAKSKLHQKIKVVTSSADPTKRLLI